MTTTGAGVRFGRPLEAKAAAGGWEVSGYVSTFGNVDQGGDVMEAGAFRRTLATGRRVKFLFAHDAAQPLGTPLELKEDATGLFGRFKISKTRLGEDVRTLLLDGGLDSFSIGYLAVDHARDRDGTRRLKDVELLECSLVALPMNEQARVSAVKGDRGPGLVAAYLRHRRLAGLTVEQQRGYSRMLAHRLTALTTAGTGAGR